VRSRDDVGNDETIWAPAGPTPYDTPAFSIEPCAEIDSAIASVAAHAAGGKWAYPPILDRDPPVPAERFELPCTHVLRSKGGTHAEDMQSFFIAFFGWLKGLHLVQEGWGHLYRVAVKCGELTDFTCYKAVVPRALELAQSFRAQHESDGAAKSLIGALHWYLFSQSYSHIFERFLMQYMVMDALYKTYSALSGKRCGSHARRVEFMADELDIELPSWGRVTGKECQISRVRNELVHESRFAGQPIGFAVTRTESTILVGLKAFNCRAIAAIVGARGPYSRSSCETMQPHGFDLD